MTEAGAQRAARYGLHMLPQGRRSSSLDVWRKEMRAAGHDPDERRVGIIRSFLVTDDRERDWPPVRAAERYRMEVYARFFREANASFTTGGPDDIPQGWVVGDADHVYRELAAFIEEYGFTDLITWGAPPGIAPERMTPNLERFAREVMPRLRERFN